MNLSMNYTVETPPISSIEFLPWNNPDNLSYTAYLAILSYYNTVMKPIVVSVCVATNTVNCLVFRRQGLKDRMNLCLFVLALVDATYLSYTMTFMVSSWIRTADPALGEEAYVKTLYYAMGINYGLREASACISVVIAVERCVCVVFPLRANSLMTTRTMARLLVAIVISMQLAFVTTPIKRYVYPVYDNSTTGITWAVATSAFWQKSDTLILYDKVEDTITMVALPLFTFLLVSGSTAITVVKLRAALSWREKTSSTGSDTHFQQVALTKMLVLVSCAFIASKLPWVVFTVVRIFFPDFYPPRRQVNLYRVLELMAHYLPYIHSTINFFIYYSQSSRFKSHLQTICVCSQKQTNCSFKKKTSLSRQY